MRFQSIPVHAFGEAKSTKDWSLDSRCGVSYSTLRARIFRDNWPPETAIIASKGYRIYTRETTCFACGTRCVSKSPETAHQSGNDFCSAYCRMRIGGDNRRARNLLAFVEEINRLEVFEAYEGECYLCWESLDYNNWHLEHIIPICKEGKHRLENVAPSHPRCNLRKGTKSYIEYISNNLPCYP